VTIGDGTANVATAGPSVGVRLAQTDCVTVESLLAFRPGNVSRVDDSLVAEDPEFESLRPNDSLDGAKIELVGRRGPAAFSANFAELADALTLSALEDDMFASTSL
jgi:hypothetical protein